MRKIITSENWKDYRASEANRLFSVDVDVQYTHGYTRFDNDNFGRVTRITPAGIIYVATMSLEEVARDLDQGGGWIDYNPKTATLHDEIIRFLPNLKYNSKYDAHAKKWNETYAITWHGPEKSGNSNLHKLEVGKNGLVRATIDSVL